MLSIPSARSFRVRYAVTSRAPPSSLASRRCSCSDCAAPTAERSEIHASTGTGLVRTLTAPHLTRCAVTCVGMSNGATTMNETSLSAGTSFAHASSAAQSGESPVPSPCSAEETTTMWNSPARSCSRCCAELPVLAAVTWYPSPSIVALILSRSLFSESTRSTWRSEVTKLRRREKTSERTSGVDGRPSHTCCVCRGIDDASSG